MTGVVFLDTETTGLDDRIEDVFEVAIVMGSGFEHVYRIRPRTAVVWRMHPKAAEVSRYHERTNPGTGWQWHDPELALDRIRDVLDGVHICGAVPDFDTRHLTSLYRRFGQDPPRWHYHLIDVEAMAVGWIWGQRDCGYRRDEEPPPLPWRSDDLSRACGVEPPDEDERHTALGDARWCKRLYETITGAVS